MMADAVCFACGAVQWTFHGSGPDGTVNDDDRGRTIRASQVTLPDGTHPMPGTEIPRQCRDCGERFGRPYPVVGPGGKVLVLR